MSIKPRSEPLFDLIFAGKPVPDEETAHKAFTRVDITRRKHKGNYNSEQAHASIRPTKRESWEKIHAFITSQGKHGATLHEVVKGIGMKVQSVSGRMSEMKIAGHPFHIFWNGEKRAVLDEHGKQSRPASAYVTSEGQLR